MYQISCKTLKFPDPESVKQGLPHTIPYPLTPSPALFRSITLTVAYTNEKGKITETASYCIGRRIVGMV